MTARAQNIDDLLTESPDRPVYTIGVAARLTDTSVSTIRMYEEKSLLLPFYTKTGRRLYSHTDIVRLKCIRNHLDSQGLNIAGIQALMALVPCWLLKPCSENDRQSCGAYTSTTQPCWAVEVKGVECEKVDCRTCPVYHLPEKCTDTKTLYKRLMTEDGNITWPETFGLTRIG